MPDTPSLKKQAIRGSLISGGGMVVARALSFIVNIIVARFLLPYDYGLSSIVNLVVVGLQMVSDLGVLQNIIQHEREDRDFLDTAFTLSVIRGVILFVAGCCAAWPAAVLYGHEELLLLLPFGALSALFHSSLPTKYALLTRRLEIGRLTIINLMSQIAGAGVMIAYAYIYRTVWALVLGAVVSAAAKWLLAVIVAPGSMDRFRWERSAVNDLVRFGKWVFVSTLLIFLAQRFDQIMLPKLEGMESAGVYNIALQFAMAPLWIGGAVVGQVLLPALSASKRDNHEAFVNNFHKAQRVLLPLHLYIVTAIVLGAPVAIALYKPVYADAAWICQLMMLSMWFQYLQEAWGQALVAVGDTRSHAISNALRLSVTVPAVLLGFQWYGVPGLICGTAVGAVTGQMFVAYRVQKLGPRVFRLDMVYLVIATILGGGGAFAGYRLADVFEVDALWTQLGVGVPIGIGLTAWLYVKVLPKLRK